MLLLGESRGEKPHRQCYNQQHHLRQSTHHTHLLIPSSERGVIYHYSTSWGERAYLKVAEPPGLSPGAKKCRKMYSTTRKTGRREPVTLNRHPFQKGI